VSWSGWPSPRVDFGKSCLELQVNCVGQNGHAKHSKKSSSSMTPAQSLNIKEIGALHLRIIMEAVRKDKSTLAAYDQKAAHKVEAAGYLQNLQFLAYNPNLLQNTYQCFC